MPIEFVHKFLPGRLPVTLLVLHGTGGDENDLVPVGRALAPGASILSPRGKVMENGAPRFFARIAPGVFDPKEVALRAGELAEWVGQFDGPIYALGYSNGANIAAAMMLLHPGAIAGAALLRPMVVIRPETLPDLKGAPVLISGGNDDPQGAEDLGLLLSSAGAYVDIAIQNAAHDLTPADFSLGKQWFARLLAEPR
ncbi:MAG TPA: alpha/beta hydrolase [Bryobacteraceae bacterium]|jgi:predicted esterase|nr:alpha/beta hydrolase [Bryobacteraceae bacterium]